MKKMHALIIVLVLIIIIMGISFFVYVRNNQNSNNVPENNVIGTENTGNSFKGYSFDEWEQMVKKFYNSYDKTDIKEVICKYDENNNFTIDAATSYEVCGEFVLDNATGYAKEKTSKVVIDFIDGVIITELKGESNIFSGDTCLAIAYIEGKNENEFIDKYFETEKVFYSITRYDFRDTLERQSQYEDKFIFVPKNKDVKISVYDCSINNNGELVKKNRLVDSSSEAFMLLEKVAESTTPMYVIEYSYKGSTSEFPLVFSGADGKLDLTENESKVKDISIYNYSYQY